MVQKTKSPRTSSTPLRSTSIAAKVRKKAVRFHAVLCCGREGLPCSQGPHRESAHCILRAPRPAQLTLMYVGLEVKGLLEALNITQMTEDLPQASLMIWSSHLPGSPPSERPGSASTKLLKVLGKGRYSTPT